MIANQFVKEIQLKAIGVADIFKDKSQSEVTGCKSQGCLLNKGPIETLLNFGNNTCIAICWYRMQGENTHCSEREAIYGLLSMK